MNVKERIIAVAKECKITINEKEELQNVDSLSIVYYIVKLEEEFDIEISDEFLISEKLKDLSFMTRLIESLVKQGNI